MKRVLVAAAILLWAVAVAAGSQATQPSEDLYVYFLTPRGNLYAVHPLPKPDTVVTPAAEPWMRNIGPLMQAATRELFGIKPVDDCDIKVRFDLTVKAMEELVGQMGEASGRKNLV